MQPLAKPCLVVDLDNLHDEDTLSRIKRLLSVGVGGSSFILKLLVRKHHIPGHRAVDNFMPFHVQLLGNGNPAMLDSELNAIYKLIYQDLRQRLLYH